MCELLSVKQKLNTLLGVDNGTGSRIHLTLPDRDGRIFGVGFLTPEADYSEVHEQFIFA